MSIYSLYAAAILEISKEAGKIIMPFYAKEDIEISAKNDASPVTEADIAANNFITKKLHELAPHIPIISEEGNELNKSLTYNNHNIFWLVDPLDGTKSFIKKRGDFTVNIALIEEGIPIGGAVTVPVKETNYFVGTDNKSYKQYKNEPPQLIQVRPIPEGGATIVCSHSHLDSETLAYINSLPKVAERVSVASSLKFCLVAEGLADIYPRFGPTCIWDTAAGHAVLKFAGGTVIKTDGSEFTYSETQILNPHFIALSQELSLLS